jgi:hypothetical protein
MSDRYQHAPMESAAHQAGQAHAQQVHEDLAAGLHDQAVLARYEGRPSESEAVSRGSTPSSGGA